MILDSPAALGLPDAKVISDLCDGVVMVVRADVTSEQDVQSVLEILDRERVLGLVLNGAKSTRRGTGTRRPERTLPERMRCAPVPAAECERWKHGTFSYRCQWRSPGPRWRRRWSRARRVRSGSSTARPIAASSFRSGMPLAGGLAVATGFAVGLAAALHVAERIHPAGPASRAWSRARPSSSSPASATTASA